MVPSSTKIQENKEITKIEAKQEVEVKQEVAEAGGRPESPIDKCAAKETRNPQGNLLRKTSFLGFCNK